MAEVDLELIRRMLEDLWEQMKPGEFYYHKPPRGAEGYWTAAYNRYLGQVRPHFADDPVFSQFAELPDGTPIGAIQMAVGQLHTYLDYQLRKSAPPAAEASDRFPPFRHLADLGRRMGEIGRAVRAASGEGIKELEARLAELQTHMGELEKRLAEKLGEAE